MVRGEDSLVVEEESGAIFNISVVEAYYPRKVLFIGMASQNLILIFSTRNA